MSDFDQGNLIDNTCNATLLEIEARVKFFERCDKILDKWLDGEIDGETRDSWLQARLAAYSRG